MDEIEIFLEERDFEENTVIIKINRSYSPDMSPEELYRVTRGKWKRRIESIEGTTLALAVCKGKIVEVYNIFSWKKSVFTDEERRNNPFNCMNRVEFDGELAEPTKREKYIGKSVAHLYKYGEANPIKTFWAMKNN